MNLPGTSVIFSPKVWIPETVEEAWKIKQEYKDDAIYIAGGTLLQMKWNKGEDAPAHLISLERIKEMQEMKEREGEHVIQLGALTSLHYCRNHPGISAKIPLLERAAKNIASPAIRNRATLGGNIAYGFGDAIPALLAMKASVTVYNGNNGETKPLFQYMNEKCKGLLQNIFIPIRTDLPTTTYFFQKIGLREAFSPSIVCVSGFCSRNELGESREILLAAGGADTPPQRLLKCEQMIKGARLQDLDWKQLHSAIADEFKPGSSFASADYKRLAAANIIVSRLRDNPDKG